LGDLGGYIIAVLMGSLGLFVPLLVGARLMVITKVISHLYKIEPGDTRLEVEIEDKLLLEDDTMTRPGKIDKKIMWNTVEGEPFWITLDPLIYFHCMYLNWC